MYQGFHTTSIVQYSEMIECHLQVLVRLYFGVDQANSVAVKVAVRSEDAEVSQIIHQIISEA